MTATFDFLITGAGILGLTLARELKVRHPGARIVVLEKEPALGLHASGRNSGVLHSGIYYPKDTLKAKLCKAGAGRMAAFALEHGIPFRRDGKVIVAVDQAQIPSVEKLMRNAQDNGIRAERLDPAGVRAIEPGVGDNVGGIHSPDTAVIDSKAVLRALSDLLVAQGVLIRTGCRNLHTDPAARVVTASDGTKYAYGFFFNAGGAHADQIARDFGLGGDYVTAPFKGLYYKLHPAVSDRVRASIYPVPNPMLPFLGVHFTRVVSGDVYVGPTAIPALGRENYGVLAGIRPLEGVRTLASLAGLFVANPQNFRGLVRQEMRHYLKRFFFESARRLVRDLKPSDLVSCGKVGIRPQLINRRTNRLEMDYVIERTADSIHLLNAISPAFTSSFAFSEYVLDTYFEGKAGPA